MKRTTSLALGCCLALLVCRCTGRRQPDPAPAPEPPASAVAAEGQAPARAADLSGAELPAAAPAQPNLVPVQFETQVRPILERCRPCHFEGGKMYARLPFDKPETVRTLGEKLFTRIRADSDQAVIRAFLAQAPAEH